jgi:hypothetical protein
MASNNRQKTWKPNGISVRDEQGNYAESYNSFKLNMAVRNCGLHVIGEIDGFDFWTPRTNDRNPDSREYGAVGTRMAWGFNRMFGEELEIPAFVSASEVGNTQSGRTATTSIVTAMVDGVLTTAAVGPYEYAGSRMVSYDDINGQMARDLAEVLVPGQIVLLHLSPNAGPLMYKGLTSPWNRDRRGGLVPHTLTYLTIDSVDDQNGKELFNTVMYPAAEGFSGLPCPPNLPEVRIDIFRGVGAEIEGKLAAMKEPHGVATPFEASGVDSSIGDLEAILAG